VRQDTAPWFNSRWHYHHEVELIHFNKGEGTQLIGDSIRTFEPGAVVLIGPGLPHYWRFNDEYRQDEAPPVDVRVCHFRPDFWGEQYLQLPENIRIKTVLEKAKRGLQINGKTREVVAAFLELLLVTEGPHRIVLLTEALTAIAACNESAPLSSIGFKHEAPASDNDRINAIYDYSLKNFRRPIQLEEIAAVANISPNSFCRYFKSKTRKTFSQFLIEMRVGYACKLLIENNLSIKQLCYESGFNNFTSFHKYFKMITGKSPLSYQKEFVKTA
jgi:AraC-type DNA-binding domain-containing proteins